MSSINGPEGVDVVYRQLEFVVLGKILEKFYLFHLAQVGYSRAIDRKQSRCRQGSTESSKVNQGFKSSLGSPNFLLPMMS